MKTKVKREYPGNIVEGYQAEGFCLVRGFPKGPCNASSERCIS